MDPSIASPSSSPPCVAKPTFLAEARQLFDELVLVFVLVMFIKMFVVELYKIPSGSMTPTLIGGRVAQVDWNIDGRKDLVFWENEGLGTPRFYEDNGQRYVYAQPQPLPYSEQNEQWLRASKVQYDRILVNKMACWLSWPRRGDIMVFKVPPQIFDPARGIYIKRVAGQGGQHLSFTSEGRLRVDGQLVTLPNFYTTQHYDPVVDTTVQGYFDLPCMRYSPMDDPAQRWLDEIQVPAGSYFMLGDNAHGSLDSRYWGPVARENFKGRAFARLMPLGQMGFLK